MITNLEKFMEEEEETSKKESDFFKIPEGTTKIRLLTDFTRAYTLFKGVYPTAKYVKALESYEEPQDGFSVQTSYWAWAIIRGETEKVKIVQLASSIARQISAIIQDKEWGFGGFPMDFDITIENSGSGGDRYSVRGSPQKSAVSEDILADLASKKSCSEIIGAIIAKQGGKAADPMRPASSTIPYPTEKHNPAF